MNVSFYIAPCIKHFCWVPMGALMCNSAEGFSMSESVCVNTGLSFETWSLLHISVLPAKHNLNPVFNILIAVCWKIDQQCWHSSALIDWTFPTIFRSFTELINELWHWRCGLSTMVTICWLIFQLIASKKDGCCRLSSTWQ